MTDQDDSVARGRALAAKLFAGTKTRSSVHDRLRGFAVRHLFGEIWQGEDLELQERSLVTCAALIAMNLPEELRLHFVGAKNVGIPRKKIEELIVHLAYYAGYPCSASASWVLNEVWPPEG